METYRTFLGSSIALRNSTGEGKEWTYKAIPMWAVTEKGMLFGLEEERRDDI